MNYRLALYSGRTWEDFRKHGARVTRFRPYRATTVKRIAKDDVLFCYMTGVMRWIGALCVGGHTESAGPVWPGPELPAQLESEPLVLLDPEGGIPLQEFGDKVDFYRCPDDWPNYRGFLRGSPSRFKDTENGSLLLSLLEEGQKANPMRRSIDEKKVYRYVQKDERQTISAVVTTPCDDVPSPVVPTDTPGEQEATLDIDIQHLHLTLSAQIGLEVWVTRNDKERTYRGQVFGGLPRMVNKLLTQSREVTNRMIELIDIPWLTVMAALIESTTAVSPLRLLAHQRSRWVRNTCLPDLWRRQRVPVGHQDSKSQAMCGGGLQLIKSFATSLEPAISRREQEGRIITAISSKRYVTLNPGVSCLKLQYGQIS